MTVAVGGGLLAAAGFARVASAIVAPSRLPSASASLRGSRSDAGFSCPASSLPGGGLFGRCGMRALDGLLGLLQRDESATRIVPDEIANQNEIGASRGEFAGFFQRHRKAHA